MYTTHFGFESKPFKPKSPKDFYRNANFDAACADILDGVRERRGFILLIGEAGVGKTFTLRRCMAEADDIRFVLLANTSLDLPDVINYLCTSLELPVDHLDFAQQQQLLQDALAGYARRNQPVALLVDDAHHLRITVLQRLWEFLVTPVIPTQRLQIVLAGLPEVEGKLRQPELRPLQEHIQVRCRLDRLSRLETGLFIHHQFMIAGHESKNLLSPAVIERIDDYCQGVPRAIAMLCDAVFLFASLESEREITLERIDEAARSCFLGERTQWPMVDGEGVRRGAPDAGTAVAAGTDEFDLQLPDLEFGFDFDALEDAAAIEQQPAPVESSVTSAAAPSGMPSDLSLELAAQPVEWTANPFAPEGGPPAGTIPAAERNSPAESPKPNQPAPPSLAPPLREFAQLLNETLTGQDRREARDREALNWIRNRYLGLAQSNEPSRCAAFEQRVARLTETQQPVLVSLATFIRGAPEADSVLCILLINPTWWLYQEIRLRLRGSDLSLANDGQVPPVRLLDGRDAHPVYVGYRHLQLSPGPTTLWLELDLRDHRGEWHAYNNRLEIRLEAVGNPEVEAEPRFERFWPTPPPEATVATGAWLMPDHGGGSGNLAYTLPLELEVDPERTYSLRAAMATTGQALGRGTPLTRALLLAENPAQAPVRIELVSRPFMIFGRHSSAAGTGFGDFTLGFVPKYNRISRLHCVICALGDQLALMPISDQGHTYTGRNDQRLERGTWHLLETGDVLDICDLYRLRLTWVRDHHSAHEALDWNPQEPREKFGHYLLGLVDVLHQRDPRIGAEETRSVLEKRYLHLLHMQEQVAQLNGVGNPGSLLYARFEREDAARRQVVHYYVPKWLSLGSAPQAGLRINAPEVAPQHAELLFRDGRYWIQNLAEPGAVRIGCHGLATNEVLALEVGDALMIGTARFAFEGY
ncbi:MAG: AAA family ATPase [Candidatus Competibacteraceae bacterium]